MKCPSGKRPYPDESIAIEALIGVWGGNSFRIGQGPVTVYQCEDCGFWHFTSKGQMHVRLEEYLRSGSIDLHRKASQWEDRLRKK